MELFNSIIIEDNTACNLRCIMCPTISYENEQRIMSDDLFDKIIEQIHLVDKISLDGWGEPLVDKKIFKRLERASMKLKENGHIGFSTNATLLSNFTTEEIINSGIKAVQVSIDSSTKEIYESIRIGANFEQVINNVKRLLELGIDVSVVMTISNKNYQNVEDFVLFMSNLGIKNIGLKPADVVSTKNVKKMTLSKADLIEIKKSVCILRNSKQVDANIFFWNFEENEKPTGNCLADPMHTIFVGVTGEVAPCCNLGHTVPRYKNMFQRCENTFKSFGNVNERSLEAIWFSDEYVAFRNQIRLNKRPSICALCEIY